MSEKKSSPSKGLELTLYYDLEADYSSGLNKILDQLNALGANGVSVSRCERKELSDKAITSVEDEIRKIKPQSHGSIVASRGKPMPLSRSKKLNLRNTPVILVKSSEGEPLYVFPCRMQEKQYDVNSGLEFLANNLSSLPSELPGEAEGGLIELLVNDPSIMEDGLKFQGTEIGVSTGKIDLLFRDKTGKLLLVEVERDASDHTVGQILRLSAGYENENDLQKGKVRAGIVCLRENNVLTGAKRASIEVWKITQKDDGSTEALKM